MVSGTKKVRSVPVYLDLLRMAGRTPKTIETYRDSLLQFSRFLSVPPEELHGHLTIENLFAYLNTPRVQSLKPNSRRTAVNCIVRYMRLNGVEFDELEHSVVKVRRPEEREDKPLEYATLSKMVDLADVHMKAVILFLISTGCRIGETAHLRTSDVHGDVVVIPNKIAKNRRGGKVYLTAEAREMLDLWLKERENWIAAADRRARNVGKPRPVKDDRLFGCGRAALEQAFARLYEKVDGEKVPCKNGKRNAVTPHSARAYFRTHAVKTMGPDLAEGILRHSGYLSAEYFRLSDEERAQQFHAGEDVLYVQRKDRRQSDNAIAQIRAEKDELEHRVRLLEQVMRAGS